MLSIFIMYSSDREAALARTVSCLRNMDLYDKCQKTIVADKKSNVCYPEWKTVDVPRVNDEFCWAYMWDAGVNTARFDNILYLDSDRMLPRSFLKLTTDVLEDDTFVFTSNHFMMLKELSVEKCQDLLDDFSLSDEDFVGSARFEARYKEPIHGPGKNVMSGSTAFTKRTYWRLGGVDPWYRGHGAFADTDFHFTARMGGCKFVDLGVPEFHFPHPKRDIEGNEIEEMRLRRMGLDNFVYYCCKWGLPLALAENVAHSCDIRRPDKYVQKKAKDFK